MHKHITGSKYNRVDVVFQHTLDLTNFNSCTSTVTDHIPWKIFFYIFFLTNFRYSELDCLFYSSFFSLFVCRFFYLSNAFTLALAFTIFTFFLFILCSEKLLSLHKLIVEVVTKEVQFLSERKS